MASLTGLEQWAFGGAGQLDPEAGHGDGAPVGAGAAGGHDEFVAGAAPDGPDLAPSAALGSGSQPRSF